MKDPSKLEDWIVKRLALMSEASASVKRGKTGRSLDYHEPHQIHADNLAAEWMSQNSFEEMMSHPARERFDRELRRVPVLSANQSMFRGRHFNPNDPNKNFSTSFGPPNPEKHEIGIGRYNQAGQAVLYLCSSEAGVRLEVQAPLGHVLMNQFFNVPADLRIADLTSNDIDPFLGNAFDRAEHMGSAEYFRSNALAHLVSSKFQGMLVPGVHGKPALLYSNLVIFSHHDIWQYWLDSSSPPRELK